MSDQVMDVAYDYWGKRIATCSSDQSIKVFDESGAKMAEWKAHYGSIWRLAWMHPEFGVALASCSFDRKVCIWEEVADAEEVAISTQSAHSCSWCVLHRLSAAAHACSPPRHLRTLDV